MSSRLFRRLRPVYPLAWLLASVLLTSCVDLAAVRSFAKTSAATADYQQVSTDYAAAAVRRQSFKPFTAVLSTQLPLDRAADIQQFDKAQAVLVAYLSALGDLAADELPSVDPEMTKLTDELKKAGFLTFTNPKAQSKTLTAAGTLAAGLIKITLDAKRQAELRRLIISSDTAVQVVAAGLANIVEKDFVGSLQAEENDEAQAYFRKVEDGATDKVLASFLVRTARLQYAAASEARVKKAQAYAQALRKIGAGHAQLRANALQLRGPALQLALRQYTTQLQKLYQALRDLR